MGTKNDFKKIISERLAGVASSFFIDKCLAIMDESADSKESYLAVAEIIRKKIAIFIGVDTAGEVFAALKNEIEHSELKPGMKRQHPRVAFRRRVCITFNEASHELETENLSEGGVYIKTKEPFPFGSEVKISIPLEAGSNVYLNGVVANINRDHGKHPPGMGIKFREISIDELRTLRTLVKEAAQDSPQGREETITKSSRANSDRPSFLS